MDNGYNIVNTSVGYTFNATGEIQLNSTSFLGVAPLANNGGLTETCALLPGSVAINAGSNNGVVGLNFDHHM